VQLNIAIAKTHMTGKPMQSNSNLSGLFVDVSCSWNAELLAQAAEDDRHYTMQTIVIRALPHNIH
jgi:hypothetical protein